MKILFIASVLASVGIAMFAGVELERMLRAGNGPKTLHGALVTRPARLAACAIVIGCLPLFVGGM